MKLKQLITTTLLIAPLATMANGLTLSSDDIRHGEFMSKKHEYQGFGCSGDNLSPHLKWSNVPKGTKSFAITVHDPDAPTGSGWWHWQVVNIPASTTELATGASQNNKLQGQPGSMQIRNDYGSAQFGGACPPPGHGAHRYNFTLHALSVAELELPKEASSALVGYMINANSIGSASIQALYRR